MTSKLFKIGSIDSKPSKPVVGQYYFCMELCEESGNFYEETLAQYQQSGAFLNTHGDNITKQMRKAAFIKISNRSADEMRKTEF